jgi:hypothetical protein
VIAVIAYTLGWLIYEQSEPMHEHLAHMIDFAQSYNAGLLAMVRGFQLETRRLGRKPNKKKDRRPGVPKLTSL